MVLKPAMNSLIDSTGTAQSSTKAVGRAERWGPPVATLASNPTASALTFHAAACSAAPVSAFTARLRPVAATATSAAAMSMASSPLYSSNSTAPWWSPTTAPNAGQAGDERPRSRVVSSNDSMALGPVSRSSTASSRARPNDS